MKSKISILYISALLGFYSAVFAEGKNAQEYHREALKKDAEAIAEMYQISHEDAFRRLKLQDAARQNLVAQIKEEFRDRFAGSYIEHDPVDRMVVRLKGAAEVATRELEVEGDVLLVEFISGQSYTRNELEEIIKRNYDKLKQSIKDLQGTATDDRTGEVVLFVYMKEIDTIKMEDLKAIGEDVLRVPVKLIRVPTRELEDYGGVRGGGNLSSGCTSGFVVKKTGPTAVRGVSTAAHCPSGNVVYSDWSGNNALLVEQDGIYSASEDLKWYKAFSYGPYFSTPMYPEFYGNSMSYPTVLTGKHTWMTVQPGENVCHRGAKTGYSCGEVSQVNYQTSVCGVSVCAATWVSVVPAGNSPSNLRCYRGDSGGPWFIGSKAVGIHHSSISSGGEAGECTLAVYMSVDRLNALNLELVYGL